MRLILVIFSTVCTCYPHHNNTWIQHNQNDSIMQNWKAIQQCYQRLTGVAPRKQDQIYMHPKSATFIKIMHTISLEYRQFLFIGDSVIRAQFVTLVCMLNASAKLIQPAHPHSEFSTYFITMSNSLNLSLVTLGLAFVQRDNFNQELTKYFRNALFETKSSRDVIVVNQGIHHNEPTLHDLSNVTRSIVQIYHEFCVTHQRRRVPLFIWQETTPQFYPTSNGWYMKGLEKQECLSVLPAIILQGQGSCRYVNMSRAEGEEVLKKCCPICLPASGRNDLTNQIIGSSSSYCSKKVLISKIFDGLVDAKVDSGYFLKKKFNDCTHLDMSAYHYLNSNLLSLVLKADKGGY
jgi:hypothetical protein